MRSYRALHPADPIILDMCSRFRDAQLPEDAQLWELTGKPGEGIVPLEPDTEPVQNINAHRYACALSLSRSPSRGPRCSSQPTQALPALYLSSFSLLLFRERKLQVAGHWVDFHTDVRVCCRFRDDTGLQDKPLWEKTGRPGEGIVPLEMDTEPVQNINAHRYMHADADTRAVYETFVCA